MINRVARSMSALYETPILDWDPVPGVFEIPGAIQMAIRTLDFTTLRTRFDGYIVLGCVIRGETNHHEIVAHESAAALQALVRKYTLARGCRR